MQWNFEYGYARVRDLRVQGQREKRRGKISIGAIEIGGEPLQPTPRFWKSFFARFGIADNVFRYFEPAEVFERISERAADDTLRYCIERGSQAATSGERGASAPCFSDPPASHHPKAAVGGRLLAVSNPRRAVIRFGEVHDLVGRHDGCDTGYADGIVTSTHRPRSGDQTFAISGDRFQHRFVLETPVDGFGQPRIFLSFLRLICSNGAIGYSRAFRSDVSVGQDVGMCIARALESYDNGDGYAALRQRFESAQRSWASVHECVKVYKLLTRMKQDQETGKETLVRDLHRLTGNLNELYGLANLDALSVKRQRVLPARCRVYDLINFASEVATHHASATGNRSIQAWIGSLISDEYDLEGTAEAAPEFADFFVSSDGGGPRASLN
ncbi:MAG: DUF932 domain-containing protein [Pirellulaceae bacterium]|nr:DUF932 domain-containing protein [Pirellulaceae bacterium]